MDYTLPGSSVHGILQARILEWVAISFPRGSPWPLNTLLLDECFYFFIVMRLLKQQILAFSLISSVQSLNHVLLFVTPWTVSHQASLSITNSQSFLKLMSMESIMPFNHLILCHPLLLLPSIFPSIRVFSNESVLRIRWPNIGVSASASVLPINI